MIAGYFRETFLKKRRLTLNSKKPEVGRWRAQGVLLPGVRLAVLWAAWLLLLAGQAPAASPLLEIKDLKQRVAADSPTTYADLLKLVFPEPAPGEKEAPAGPLVRKIDDDDYGPQPLKAKPSDMSISVLPLKAQGRQLLLIAFWASTENGFSLHLLGLFQTAPAPKLLDLLDLDLSMFQFSGFWAKNPRLELTPGTEACIIEKEHLVASLSQIHYQLLWVRNQRLDELLCVYAYSANGLWEIFTTRPVFWTEPDKGRKFPKVVAKLTLRVKPAPWRDKESQQPQRHFARSYLGVWRWDPSKQKYDQASGNLKALYKFYER